MPAESRYNTYNKIPEPIEKAQLSPKGIAKLRFAFGETTFLFTLAYRR